MICPIPSSALRTLSGDRLEARKCIVDAFSMAKISPEKEAQNNVGRESRGLNQPGTMGIGFIINHAH